MQNGGVPELWRGAGVREPRPPGGAHTFMHVTQFLKPSSFPLLFTLRNCILLESRNSILRQAKLGDNTVSYTRLPPGLSIFNRRPVPHLSTELSSSPPGPYHQEPYVSKPEERFKAPPILPPHLLQVILNKDTGISVSTGAPALPAVHCSGRPLHEPASATQLAPSQ